MKQVKWIFSCSKLMFNVYLSASRKIIRRWIGAEIDTRRFEYDISNVKIWQSQEYIGAARKLKLIN